MLSPTRDPSPFVAPPIPALSAPLTDPEFEAAQRAIEAYSERFIAMGLRLHVLRDFGRYVATRRAHGDHHLNQAFDPAHAQFDRRDFWLLLEERSGDAVATYCTRIFEVENFYHEVQTQRLWFGPKLRLVDQRFVVSCSIPAFGGVVAHDGGMWVRPDCRGGGISKVLPRLARALALRNANIDHDCGMFLNAPDPERLAVRNYGYARVELMVDGWFAPEQETAVVHLGHADRSECLASLAEPAPALLAA
jgi:hypothetical protein